MKIITASNPRATAIGILLDVTFDPAGDVLFHAIPDDVEEHGRELYRRAMTGEFGPVSPYAPGSPTIPESITPRQGYIILSRYGLLSPVQAYFTGLEGQEGEEARIELEYAQEWRRDWPTLVAAATVFGLTSEQIDQMFIEAAAL